MSVRHLCRERFIRAMTPPTNRSMTDNAAPQWFRPRAERYVRLLRWLLVAAMATYVAASVPGVRHLTGYDVLLDGYLSTGIILLAGGLMFVRAALVPARRVAWAMMGVAVVIYAAGDIAYNGWVQFHDPVPVPSVADVLWLAFYPFAYVGILLLLRGRVRVFHASMWLDGVVGMLGAAAVGSIAVGFVVRHTGGTHAEVVTTIAYPLADLFLLAIVVGSCGLFRWRPDRAWTLVGIGLVTYAAADVIYLLRVANETYQSGTLLDPMWAVGYGITGLAAVTRLRHQDDRPGFDGWSVLLVPSLFTLASLGLLVWGSMARLPRETDWLAAACVACGLGRTALTFREVQRLADSKRQARTDDLTGLGNRRHLYEVLQGHLDTLAPGVHAAVMLVDLDRFKEVNDSLGHLAGDQLLVEVGNRLGGLVRRGDELVRLGGDEFAVALPDTTERAALHVAERVRQELERAFLLDGVIVHIGASIGIALAPDVGRDVDALLQRADIAVYEAKSERLGCVVYQASADDDLRRRIETVNALRDAIDGDQLVLYYQPKADLRTGRITAVEALVRWQHPQRGLVFPDEFIPDAERAGFMRKLTARVLGLAADQAAVWQRAGHPLPISVNVSASNLLDVELPDQVFTLLATRGLPPSALVVEITESTLMVDPTRSLAVLNRLRAGGVRISVDDYGTGYSSLAYLRDLPVDELKLDRSFTTDLDTDPRSAAIVESTVRLAHSLGLPLVAEGVETAEIWQRLAEFGCDYGQGYYLSRPVPPERIEELVAAYSR
jgi:diguanylate cyclase (GGDEF)-like protein